MRMYPNSKFHRVFIHYSQDTEVYKRDYAKSESLLHEGITVSDDIDIMGTELLLRHYGEFAIRMLERVKRDVYDQLSRDAWREWVAERGSVGFVPVRTWDEYKEVMAIKVAGVGGSGATGKGL